MTDETLPAGGTETAAPEPSVDERLGAFDFDQQEPEGEKPVTEPDDKAEAEVVETEPDTDDAETQKVRLRDGKEISIAELKKAYNPNWEKETREFEERRRKFDDDHQKATRHFQALTQREQQLSQTIDTALIVLQNRLPKAPTKELFEQDPFEYQRQKLVYDEAQTEITDLTQKQQQLQQVAQARQQEAELEHIRKQNELLVTALPELKDPAKAAKFWEKTQALGAALGFTTREMAQISDARILLLANDAIKWREHSAASAKLKQKEKEAVPMAPPAQAPARRVSTAEREAAIRREQLSKLSKTGSTRDAEAFLSRFD